MNIFHFFRPPDSSAPEPSSPEEMIEVRLETVRRRANLLIVERALCDFCAVALGAAYAWHLLSRTLGASSPFRFLPLCIAVAFAAYSLARVHTRWTSKAGAAALLDGEMKLKQRLVTFREYSGERVKPRLYERLAQDIATELAPGNIRRILPHRAPQSAFVALAILLAMLLGRPLRTDGDKKALREEQRVAVKNETREEEATPTAKAEEAEQAAQQEKEQPKASQEDSQQLAQMKKDIQNTMQDISRQLDQMEKESPGGKEGGRDGNRDGEGAKGLSGEQKNQGAQGKTDKPDKQKGDSWSWQLGEEKNQAAEKQQGEGAKGQAGGKDDSGQRDSKKSPGSPPPQEQQKKQEGKKDSPQQQGQQEKNEGEAPSAGDSSPGGGLNSLSAGGAKSESTGGNAGSGASGERGGESASGR